MELTPCLLFVFFCRTCAPHGELRECVEDDEEVELLLPDVCPKCAGPASSRYLGCGQTVRALPFCQIINRDFAERTNPARRNPTLCASALKNLPNACC